MVMWTSNLTIKEMKKEKQGDNVFFTDGKNKIECRYEYDHGVLKFWMTDSELPAHRRESLFTTWNTTISDLLKHKYVDVIIDDNFYEELENTKKVLKEKDTLSIKCMKKLSKRMKNFKTEDIGKIVEEVSRETKLRKLGYVEAVLEQHGFLELAEFIRNLEVL